MNITVRYYSRSGNTKLLAETIANEAHVKAVSVDSIDAEIKEPVDLLFIGGALYAYGLDKHLKEYLKTLKKEYVKKAVVFSTSWLSKHSIDLIKKALRENGIEVEDEFIYAKNKPSLEKLEEAKNVVKKFC
ncbi:MAG: flavodoxin [Lachnospiraceae bacterium]|nr:flavodoxin [Lachnospiraceae bacterium]